jgi:molybdate-binding protein
VADAVQAGWADAGITLELCAYEGGLGFVPLRTEGLDLVFTEQLMDDPRLQKLVALLQGRAYRRAEGSIRGYSTARAGSLVHS